MDGVRAELMGMGIHLKDAFIAEVLMLLGTRATSLEEQVQLVFAHLLTADLNTCGSGCLPADVQSQHNTVLRGRYVLQIDETTDVATCAKQRWVELLNNRSTAMECWMLMQPLAMVVIIETLLMQV